MTPGSGPTRFPSYVNRQGNIVPGISDLQNAINSDPNGLTCAFCGGLNLNADDCGFFYLWPIKYGPSGPACEKCEFGVPGQLHRERFGVGNVRVRYHGRFWRWLTLAGWSTEFVRLPEMIAEMSSPIN